MSRPLTHKERYDIARPSAVELLGIETFEQRVAVETKDGVKPFRFTLYIADGINEDIAQVPVAHARGDGQPDIALFARVDNDTQTPELVGWEFWKILTMGEKTCIKPGEDAWMIDVGKARPMADIRFRIMGEFEE